MTDCKMMELVKVKGKAAADVPLANKRVGSAVVTIATPITEMNAKIQRHVKMPQKRNSRLS